MASLPVTMKTVATRAGVSLMTVSRVLRNNRHVAEATREKVLAAVRETGYRTNPLVGAWMAHIRTSQVRPSSQQTLAFVMVKRTESLTLLRYFEGAQARAEERGFKLESFSMEQKGMTGARLSDVLRARGIGGLMIAPIPQPVSTIDLRWSWFAAAAFGYSMREPTLHRVTNHHIHSVRLALNEARNLGYGRIGLALARVNDLRVDHNWTTGLLAYQESILRRERVPPHLPEQIEPKQFLAWVKKHKPDLILGGRTEMVEWLETAGWRVPDDIGFATLEYYPEHGALAGVDQNSLTIGAAAADLVIEQLHHNERGIPEKPKVVLIEGRWQPGDTIRKRVPAGRT